MAQCPFWSNERVKVGCYKECPMNEIITGEECIFSLYLDKNSLGDDENKDSELVLCASN
ncbi:hypothetical protein [Clostridium sp. B9]|uniref:hypothetical protein n=1 Tax=Clostridium sp. B9 TaxID=3423224 RepID=UPI003D2F380E